MNKNRYYEREQVYRTMIGELLTEDRVPGVANELAMYSYCQRLEEQINKAEERICLRLGALSDPDVKILTQTLMEIQKHLCLTMFDHGYRMAMERRDSEKLE